MTGPYSPTTTGKIERFHRSLRTEFLAGRVFTSQGHAQAELDGWVMAYNQQRPHQGIGMATPASRFTSPVPPPGPPLARAPGRDSGDWVTRKVGANGVISLAWRQVSVGKHRAGEVVDVHLTPTLIQVWHRDELLKTTARDGIREVRKKNTAVTR